MKRKLENAVNAFLKNDQNYIWSYRFFKYSVAIFWVYLVYIAFRTGPSVPIINISGKTVDREAFRIGGSIVQRPRLHGRTLYLQEVPFAKEFNIPRGEVFVVRYSPETTEFFWEYAAFFDLLGDKYKYAKRGTVKMDILPEGYSHVDIKKGKFYRIFPEK